MGTTKAKARKVPRRTQPQRKITLTMTEGDADLVLAMVSMAGGHRSKSPRKYAERVRKALEEALGYNWKDTDAFRLGMGSVEFFNYKNPPVITPGERSLAHLTSLPFQKSNAYYGREELSELTELVALAAMGAGLADIAEADFFDLDAAGGVPA